MKAAGMAARLVALALSLALAVCTFVPASALAQQSQPQPLNFFQYNQGNAIGTIADDINAADSNLFTVPAVIEFQYMIYRVGKVDLSGNPYDMGVGDCPYTTPAHDCSQTGAQIVVVCNTGNPGALIVNAMGAQKVACVQGVVVLQPGVYMHLSAASGSLVAKCYGTGTPLSPFASSPIKTYIVENGSLTQSSYPLVTADRPGGHSSVNGCAVGLSMH